MPKQKTIINAEKALKKTELCLTAKMKIQPDKSAKAALLRTMRTYRNACNHISNVAFKHQMTKAFSLHRYLYGTVREKYGMGAQMTQSTFRTVSAACRAQKTKNNWTRAVKFHYPHAVWLHQRDYSVTDGSVKLRTLNGWVNVPLVIQGHEEYFDDIWKWGAARIKMYGGVWFLEVAITRNVSTLPVSSTPTVVGVDVGLNFLLTTYDSEGNTQFFHGRAVKHRRQRYFNLRRTLSRKGTKSAQRRLGAIGRRERRWMQDVNHRISKTLVCSYPPGTVFVLEDLKGLNAKSRKSGRYYALTAWAYADLREKIEYKAMQHGSRTITVPPEYTSQTCPKCGYQSQDNRNRKKHEFKCRQCGYTTNDDRAAAMNLCKLGEETIRAVRAGHDS
ncbi:transposase [Christensenellaceae bacterium OttesenSCG-928-K19]|nr:transposase [Christensenellaceae bacterium OttesenSCG-928-K19]